ncbi:hypothetical protein HCN44_000839 [Aphidius gifuensis]|uniref:Uncharacterized protein n=1 Tax=Aphidius gifuensis TaxID=684658 RepID=A0A835CNP3_APHGI|nr:hypothetical protein HCN44_000839 [Aphidius gifuensis]
MEIREPASVQTHGSLNTRQKKNNKNSSINKRKNTEIISSLTSNSEEDSVNNIRLDSDNEERSEEENKEIHDAQNELVMTIIRDIRESDEALEQTNFIVHLGQRNGKRYLFRGKVYYYDRTITGGIRIYPCRFKAQHCSGQVYEYPDGKVEEDENERHQHDHQYVTDTDPIDEAAYYEQLRNEAETTKKSSKDIVLDVSNSSAHRYRKITDVKILKSVESWVKRKKMQQQNSLEFKDISDFGFAAVEESPFVINNLIPWSSERKRFRSSKRIPGLSDDREMNINNTNEEVDNEENSTYFDGNECQLQMNVARDIDIPRRKLVKNVVPTPEVKEKFIKKVEGIKSKQARHEPKWQNDFILTAQGRARRIIK